MTRTLSRYIPALHGWQAVLAVTLGIFVLYVAARLIWANVSFSATGGVEMTGGKVVVDQSDVWSPAVDVTRGGVIGLELAMLGGGLFSVIQVLFWLTTESTDAHDEDDNGQDDDLSMLERVKVAFLSFKNNPLPLVFGLSMCADIFATWYYLNIAYSGDSEGVLSLVVRYIATLFFTFLFFSFGSELWAAVGWELVSKNWREALRTVVEDWQFGLAPLLAVWAYVAHKPSARKDERRIPRALQPQAQRAHTQPKAQRPPASGQRPPQRTVDWQDEDQD